MEENSSEYSLFRILPCYKYQNELDKFIKFSDDIYIASALEYISKDAYLALATTISTQKENNNTKPVKYKSVPENESDEDAADDTNILHDDFIIAFERTSKFRFLFSL